MIVSQAFKDRSYLVLGLARSGMAVAEALLASGAKVTAWDRRHEPRNQLAGRATLADPMTLDLVQFDAIVLSPGVPLNTHPLAEKARVAGVPIIGDIELFALARGDLPPHRVIGITGTNGKSTTTALTHHLLEQAGVPTRMGGNIGLPILAQDPLEPEDGKPGVYVLELSSYQIDLTRSLACEAAALTNITPDHLDRYDGFEDYAFAKARLFAMQGTGQFATFGCADDPTRAVQLAESARRPAGRASCVDQSWLENRAGEWPSLQGPHNLQNASIAAALVMELGLTREQVLAGLAGFPGLPHRMERLGEHDGVLFVNDSKATNPASTAPALGAYPPNPEKRLHWICGGLPKGEGLEECAPFFGNVKAAYTIGEAGPEYARLLKDHMLATNCEMLGEAVQRAMDAAVPGDVILLSPACASFDQFRDFEARGEAFRQTVDRLAAERAGVPMAGELAGRHGDTRT